VKDILGYAISQDFSNGVTQIAADANYDTLDDATATLNGLGALTPRFFVGNTPLVRSIAKDSRVMSGDYHAQLQDADPYTRLLNLAGFTEVREFPNFPSNPVVGTFTAATSDVLTVTPKQGVPPLNNGDKVRVTNVGGALPAGLTVDTDYYVINADTDAGTCKLSATLGGSAVDITGTGTGTQTIQHFEQTSGIAFEKRAIHVAFRQMLDAAEVADQLGIPKTYLSKTMTDPESGLTFTAFLWQHQTTHDIFVAFVTLYGIRAGRGIYGGTNPGGQPAGTALDNAALLIREVALS
jgi:hypothetical protein